MPDQFLEYYAYFLIASGLLTGLGYGILRLLNRVPEKMYAAFFASALTGVTVFVAGISIYATHGRTINLGLILLAGLALWFAPKAGAGISMAPPKPFKRTGYLKTGAELVGISLLLFGFVWWQNNGFNGFGAVRSDESFYAKLSHAIWVSGIESYNLEVIYPAANSISPYHYFELWLTAGLAALFSLNNYFCLVLLTASLVIFIFYLGICAVFEVYGTLTVILKTSGLLLLFTSGIYFTFFDNIPVANRAGFLQNGLFYNPKCFATYLFLLAAALTWLYRNYVWSLVLLLALPLISILTAPGILLALPVFACYLLISRREKQKGYYLLFGSFFIAFFIAGFYLVGRSGTSIHQANLAEHLRVSVFTGLKRGLKLGAEAIIQIGALYAVYLLAVLLLVPFRSLKECYRKERGLILAGLIFSCSLVVWLILKDMIDAFQLFLGISVPLLNILLVIFLARNLTLSKQKIVVGCFLVLLAGLTIPQSIKVGKIRPEPENRYVPEVLKATADLNPVGAFIRGKGEYWIIFTMNTNTYPLGDYLVLNSPRHHTIGLSIFDIPLEPQQEYFETKKKLVAQTSFFQFVQKQKAKGTYRSVPQSQADFVEQYNIEYVLVGKSGQLPQELAAQVKKVIEDPVSGERCYLLK
jgi:hypothetical protein